ncbi:hypothetical protein [Methanobrevibacter sp. DSM 116169]|uniref:hypothetical protein n=1 Tax=Methanobrevibacter sp. DSM 116169 TaxID=3242727 RepID=UPI0038FC87BF
MNNNLKIVFGIAITAIGAFITYEAMVLNLIELIVLLGILLTIMGVFLIVSFFVDVSSITNEFLKEANIDGVSDSAPLKVKNNNEPTKFKKNIKKADFSNKNNNKPAFKNEIRAPDNEPNEVLDIKEYSEEPSFEDNKLVFTPNYEKPVPVTRKPKKRSAHFEEEISYQNDLDKTDEIKKALSNSYSTDIKEPIYETENLMPRDIKIDLNNPESLPIPNILKSFIISNKGTIASEEAFEDLTIRAKNNLMLEIPNLAKLNDRLLSYVPTTQSRIIIEEFDITNTSYVLLITSLLKQNVHIKTLPKIDITNLVTDNSALIVADNLMDNDGEYGAIYEDVSDISQIKEIFEKSWNIAKDIDLNLLIA